MKTTMGRVYRRGKKGLYTAEWMFRGKRYKQSTDTSNKAEAERMLAEWTRPFLMKDETAILEAMAHKVKTAAPGCPIAGALDRVLEGLGGEIVEGTVENYQAAWNDFLAWMGKRYPKISDMGEVTEEMAGEFLAYDVRKGLSNGTVNNRKHKLSKIWKVLRLPNNPWKAQKSRRRTPTNKVPFTREEIQELIGKSKRFSDLYVLASQTGMRFSDCCRLDWRNIDWNRGRNGMIHIVPLKTQKTGKEISCPVSDVLLETLRRIGIRKSGLVCGIEYGHTVHIAVNKDIERIVGKGKTFHCFRHYFISELGNRGVSLQLVRTMVGHMDPEMTMRYFHPEDDALDRIMQSL